MKKLKSILRKFAWIFNHLPFNNKFRRRSCKLICNKTLMRRSVIDCKGSNNRIIFNNGCTFTNSRFYIRGNNNIIEIGENVRFCNVEIWIEDDGNKVIVKNNCNLCGKAHLACTEGKTITIGEDCLFSSDIVFRTGDSHSVIDMQGNRINMAEDIKIGNHVWICHRVLVCKGVIVSDNSIVGTGAVVTGHFTESNVAIAGVPAKVIKKSINWREER